MTSLKIATVFSLLALSTFAQTPGAFVNVGGGLARFNAGSFTETTSFGEVLQTTDKRDAVGTAHIAFGYQFDENWDLAVRTTIYGTAELKMSFPQYPGIMSILPMPSYTRNVLKYDAVQFALIPSYTYAFTEKLRGRASAGLTCIESKSHFETTYYAWFSGRPNGTFSESYTKEKNTAWSYQVSLGAEYAVTHNLSIGITGGYAPFKIKTPPTNIFVATRPSKSKVNVDAFEADLAINWRQ